IAESIVGAPGEWAEADDMLERWLMTLQDVQAEDGSMVPGTYWGDTAAGITSADEAYSLYNETVQAGYRIQESNVRVQDLLNDVRAKQLPLLAEEQSAYEQNLRSISEMGAAEQRRVLMLQDSGVQAQIATLYNTAYSASLGEVPTEVATEMILNAADADAGLKDLLLQLGLITETEGELVVNFPGADATINAIDRVTLAFLRIQAMAEGVTVLELATEIYGETEALDLLDMVKNADGTYSKVTVDADTAGANESVTDFINRVGGIDGTSATATVTADTAAADESVTDFVNRIGGIDGTKIKIPAELDIQNGMYGDGTGGASPFSTTVKVPAELDLPGTIENVPEAEVPVTFDTTNAVVPDMDPISVPVTFDVAEAALPTMDPISIPVTFDIDATAITNAMAEWSMGGEVAGPVVTFAKEDGEVHMALGDWQAVGAVAGPIVAFGTDAAIPQASLDRWTGMGAVSGPIVTFGTDAAIPQASLDRWTGMGTVTGPIVAFSANTSEVTSALQAFSGTRVIGTRVVDVVTRNRTVNFGGGPNERHGGMAGYALGGNVVPIWAAEAGPEIEHFAGGGSALIPREGLHMARQGSFIEPANSARASISEPGPTGDVHLHIYGHVYGIDDLAAAFEGAIDQRRRAFGARGGR
ncbi:MAG: hypothetical protein M3440_04545, partial [Chloroflexota bacterium]|nr:hypothetical protein [Chloroflexota bacterium]